MKVNLKAHPAHLSGTTISSRWGKVSFDAQGGGTLDVPEEDLPMLRMLGWLAEEQPSGISGTPQEAILAAQAAGESLPGVEPAKPELKPKKR